MSKDRRRKTSDDQVPFLDLRIGGLHLTIHKIPYRLLSLVTAAAGAGTVWFLH